MRVTTSTDVVYRRRFITIEVTELEIERPGPVQDFLFRLRDDYAGTMDRLSAEESE